MKKHCLNFVIYLSAVLLINCSGSGGDSSTASANKASILSSEISVNMSTPTPDSVGVSLIPEIQLQFNEPALNVKYPNVSLHEYSPTGPEIQITNIIAGNNNSFTFSPTVPLKHLTKYYVVVTNGITNTNGAALNDTDFSFTTGKFVAPTAAIISPTNNSTGVNLTPNIIISFSESVENISNENVTLVKGSLNGQSVAIGQIIAGAHNIYSFAPATRLENDAKYYVVLSSNITDTSGNHLKETDFNFTTGNFIEPEAEMIYPVNGARNVSLKPNIELRFSKNVKNVNSTQVTLHENSIFGQTLDISEILPSDNNTYTFNPLNALKAETTYYVVLSNKIVDDSGNHLNETIFYFTTGKHETPVATMLSPTNGTINASVHPDIKIKFSMPVLNVTTSNIIIHSKTADGTIVPYSSIITGTNDTYTLVGASLESYTRYYIALSNKITSTDYTPLENTTFNFTTGSNITLAGPIANNYVANDELMLYTNNSSTALTITQIKSNAAVQILFPSSGDNCTNKTINTRSTCTIKVGVPSYYSIPTLINIIFTYSNGTQSIFPIYVSHLAVM